MSQLQRLERTKKQIRGTTDKPRLSVTISNKHVIAQIIDDTAANTLAYSTSTVFEDDANSSLTEKAQKVGEDIAKKAKKAKIKKVVFDRRGKKFHGRVAALAEAARKQGLEF